MQGHRFNVEIALFIRFPAHIFERTGKRNDENVSFVSLSALIHDAREEEKDENN